MRTANSRFGYATGSGNLVSFLRALGAFTSLGPDLLQLLYAEAAAAATAAVVEGEAPVVGVTKTLMGRGTATAGTIGRLGPHPLLSPSLEGLKTPATVAGIA